MEFKSGGWFDSPDTLLELMQSSKTLKRGKYLEGRYIWQPSDCTGEASSGKTLQQHWIQYGPLDKTFEGAQHSLLGNYKGANSFRRSYRGERAWRHCSPCEDKEPSTATGLELRNQTKWWLHQSVSWCQSIVAADRSKLPTWLEVWTNASSHCRTETPKKDHYHNPVSNFSWTIVDLTALVNHEVISIERDDYLLFDVLYQRTTSVCSTVLQAEAEGSRLSHYFLSLTTCVSIQKHKVFR